MMRPAKFFFIGLLLVLNHVQAQEGNIAADIADITSELGPKLTRKKNSGWNDGGRNNNNGYNQSGQYAPSPSGMPTTYPSTAGQYSPSIPPTDSGQDTSGDQLGGDGTTADQAPTSTPSVPTIVPPAGQAKIPFPPKQTPGVPVEQQPFQGERLPMQRLPQRTQSEGTRVSVSEADSDKPADQASQPSQPVQPSAQTLEEELVGKDAQELYMEPGNYLRKAKALRKGQEGYELLRALLSSLEDNEKKLVEQRLAIDEQLQDFYSTIGFSQGQLQQRINELIQNLTQDQMLDGELSEEERELQQELTQQLDQLKKIQEDIGILGKLLFDLDKGIVKATDQVAQVRDYEARAWKNYQTIDALRNDQEAMALADEIGADDNSFVANTKKIQSWLQGPFNSFFMQTIAAIKQQIKAVQDNLADLDKQGVQLSKKTADAEKAEADKRAAEEKARKDKQAAEQAAQQKNSSFLNRVANFFSSVLVSIKNFGHQIYLALFGWISKK